MREYLPLLRLTLGIRNIPHLDRDDLTIIAPSSSRDPRKRLTDQLVPLLTGEATVPAGRYIRPALLSQEALFEDTAIGELFRMSDQTARRAPAQDTMPELNQFAYRVCVNAGMPRWVFTNLILGHDQQVRTAWAAHQTLPEHNRAVTARLARDGAAQIVDTIITPGWIITRLPYVVATLYARRYARPLQDVLDLLTAYGPVARTSLRKLLSGQLRGRKHTAATTVLTDRRTVLVMMQTLAREIGPLAPLDLPDTPNLAVTVPTDLPVPAPPKRQSIPKPDRVYLDPQVRVLREAKQWTYRAFYKTYKDRFPDWPAGADAYAQLELGNRYTNRATADATLAFVRDELPAQHLAAGGTRPAGRTYDTSRGIWLLNTLKKRNIPVKEASRLLGYSDSYIHTVVANGWGVKADQWPILAATLHRLYPSAGFDLLPGEGAPCPPALAEEITALWTARGWIANQRLSQVITNLADPSNDPAGWFTYPQASTGLPVAHLTDGRWLHHPDAWPVLRTLSAALPTNDYPDQVIADQMKTTRTQLGYTQATFAAAITNALGERVGVNTIRRIEQSTNAPANIAAILTAMKTLPPAPKPPAQPKPWNWVYGPIDWASLPAPPTPEPDTIPDWGAWLTQWCTDHDVPILTLMRVLNQHYPVKVTYTQLARMQKGTYTRATLTDARRLAQLVMDATTWHIPHLPDPAWTDRFNTLAAQTGWTLRHLGAVIGVGDGLEASTAYRHITAIKNGTRELTRLQQDHYMHTLEQTLRHAA